MADPRQPQEQKFQSLINFAVSKYQSSTYIVSSSILVFIVIIVITVLHVFALVLYCKLAVSTRPPDAVVSALRASILSVLAGLCKEFFWLSPGGAT